MPSPVKVSDRLLALAREEAQGTHRSATAQIEHWATLGRAVEVMVAYRDVLALKRAGQALPIPAFVRREEAHELLARLVEDVDREEVKARIRAAGTPLYTTDPDYPGMIVEVEADGTRIPGHLEGRRFVPAGGKSATRRK
ncbi:MAG: TA system antitoxin ParD family protein [Candidatus Rokuibacteriota bacterium]